MTVVWLFKDKIHYIKQNITGKSISRKYGELLKETETVKINYHLVLQIQQHTYLELHFGLASQAKDRKGGRISIKMKAF